MRSWAVHVKQLACSKGGHTRRLPFFALCEPPPVYMLAVGQLPALLLTPPSPFLDCVSSSSLLPQVELNNVRSFYKEAQKSPFKYFPWKTGNMHFKFLPVRGSSVLGCKAPGMCWHMLCCVVLCLGWLE